MNSEWMPLGEVTEAKRDPPSVPVSNTAVNRLHFSRKIFSTFQYLFISSLCFVVVFLL